MLGLKATAKDGGAPGVEMFRKRSWIEGQAGDNVGVLLRGHEARGSRARAGTGQAREPFTPHTHFECEVYVLAKEEEGGRHTAVLAKGIGRSFTFARRM